MPEHSSRKTARALLSGLAILAGILALALPIHGEIMDWEGTLRVEFIGPVPDVSFTGGGVATVDGPAFAVTALSLSGGVSGNGVVPVTDPEISGTVKSVIVSARLGTGQLDISPFAGAGQPRVTGGKLPIPGLVKICVVLSQCASPVPLPLTETHQGMVTRGVGVGGLITAGGAGAIRVSLYNHAWTLGAGTLTVPPEEGSYVVQATGYQHGPNSIRGTTRNCVDLDLDGIAETCGTMQFVTPTQIVSGDFHPGLIGELTIRFVPEPGKGLLLGSGVIVVALLSRRRLAAR